MRDYVHLLFLERERDWEREDETLAKHHWKALYYFSLWKQRSGGKGKRGRGNMLVLTEGCSEKARVWMGFRISFSEALPGT